MNNRRGLRRSRHAKMSSASAADRAARLKVLVIVLFLSSAVLAGFGSLAASRNSHEGYQLPMSIFRTGARRSVPPAPPRQRLFLSKEYIYSDSRVLAVEDAGAVGGSGAGFAEWKPPDRPDDASTKENVRGRPRFDESK